MSAWYSAIDLQRTPANGRRTPRGRLPSLQAPYRLTTARGADMLPDVGRQGRTRLIVERRLYFFERWEDSIAERVRAERHDEGAWVRVLEAIYWWPEHEGKEWPAMVI